MRYLLFASLAALLGGCYTSMTTSPTSRPPAIYANQGVPRGAPVELLRYEVVTEYDRFTDVTIITLEPRVELSGGQWPALTVRAACTGDTVCRPEQVGLTFVSASSDWRYLTDHALHLIVDGDRHGFDTDHDGSTHRGGVSETMFVRVPIGLLEDIAYATEVEGRIGRDEFTLTEVQRYALQEYIAALKDPDDAD